MNGEITAINGTFSNGLGHPGDKSGSISEWIRCRCTLSPYIMPIGKAAPDGALHFRESDLVDLDLDFNIDDYTLQDALSGNWNKIKVNDNDDVVGKVVNINMDRLTKNQQTRYNNLLKKLADFNLNKKERNRLKKQKEKYERIISDERIIKRTSGHKFNDPHYNDETFEEYLLSDGKKLYISDKYMEVDVVDAIDMMEDIHPVLKRNYDEILISSKSYFKSPITDGTSIGFVRPGSKRVNLAQLKENMKEMKSTLIHEATHLLENSQDYFVSNSKKYLNVYLKDKKNLLKRVKNKEDACISKYQYACETNPKYMAMVKGRELSEDFAESVMEYFINPKTFKKRFKNKAKFFDDLFKQDDIKKSSTYKKWVKDNIDKYELTASQRKRLDKAEKLMNNQAEFMKLNWQKQEEVMEDFFSLKDLQYFNKLHNKRVKDGFLVDSDRTEYIRLHNSLKEKGLISDELDFNSTLFKEIVDDSYKFELTPDEKKLYAFLKNKEKLKFKDKRKLRDLEAKIELDNLHKKKVNSSLSDTELKKYNELLKKTDNVEIKPTKTTSISTDRRRFNQLAEKKINNELTDAETEEYYKLWEKVKDDFYNFVGVSNDGSLPGGELIDKYFSLNVKNTSKFDNFIEDWVYNGKYLDVQHWDNELNFDIKKYIKYLKEQKPNITDDELKNEIWMISQEWKKVKELFESNETLEDLILYRTQEELFFDPTVGTIGTINSFRSTAISQGGLKDFMRNSRKSFWKMKIYAPKGTKGAYIAPKATSIEDKDKYIKQMEFVLNKDTKVEVMEVNEETKEIVLKVVV